MKQPIKVAFASGSEDLIPTLIERMQALRPELPLYIVSEFPAEGGRWIPYHMSRGFRDNLERLRAALQDKQVVYAGLILQPRMPYWKMRFVPLWLWPLRVIAYNENLDHFMLRPRSAGTMARHFLWRAKNFVRWELRPGGAVYTFLWRLAHPWAFVRPVVYAAARLAGFAAAAMKALMPPRNDTEVAAGPKEGVSVVVPSRNGKDLLARLLPDVVRQLPPAGEVIVVDNGSDDGTAPWLAENFPKAVLEACRAPLSFSAAVNRGIRRARYSHVCLLNNDMVIEEGFFTALLDAFRRVPELFAATAEILFPEGVRREETGKAVMAPRASRKPTDFPVRCELPVAGEDLSYVLYGSGGCTLYDTAKLRALGGLDEIYAPAYVEDLDLGYRAWLRGWPTVFTSGARLLHRHRATTSRYFTPAQLTLMLERNYLRFVARATVSPAVFRRLWSEALDRLNCQAAVMTPPPEPLAALKLACRVPFWLGRAPATARDENEFLELTSGAVAVFPGRAPSGRPVVLVAAPYAPFPLSHGGAVRIYNLMHRAAKDFDQVLVIFSDELTPPPRELLDLCVEIVQVRRVGSHLQPRTPRPDVVEEFASLAFGAVLREMVRKWRPGVAQLEFTQLAQYAAHCRPARTILVEHDVTLDLHAQLLAEGEDWELRRQFERWVQFETRAWREVDAVVTMSEKDRRLVNAARSVVLENGVDLARFQPVADEPEAGRILFIGSFAHLPNVMAVEFFLREVWDRLARHHPTLHIIAGSRHEYYLERYKDRVMVDLHRPGIEVQDFVADVRPAYRRAAVVVAPLVASAGTNIKIMEAMAMGKAIVSTPAGINGLELEAGRDVFVASSGAEMADAIGMLLGDGEHRRSLERQARQTAEERYDWDRIAGEQKRLYEELSGRG